VRLLSRWVVILAVGGALLGADPAPPPTPAASQPVRTDTDVARRAHAMAAELMSPYCPGRTLADCPSPSAAALREEVRGLIAQGVSEEQIRSTLSAQFGDAIVGTPRSAVGWALPGLVLAAGALLLIVALRRLSAVRAEPAPATDSALEAEIAEELRQRGL
jgi:cytochrome c-type biogenesis protein CcmH